MSELANKIGAGRFVVTGELTPPAIAALRRLSGTGVNLISQSVLLRGVNDDAETLAASAGSPS